MTKIMRVVRSSDVAKHVIKPNYCDDTNAIFGKIFEECYTYATYLHERGTVGRGSNKKFAAKMAMELKSADIFSYDLMNKAYRMYSCLLFNKVFGSKPRTEFRLHKDIIIAAQPDLECDDPHIYFEFKTYPIDEYGRYQSLMFSWVLKSSITLIGLNDNGIYIVAEKEIIDATNFILPEIPETLGKPQEFCLKCMSPAEKCRCNFHCDEDEFEEDEFEK
jgi:hypothetical protein